MRKRMASYLVCRMAEGSTWRGLIMIAAAFGAKVSPDQAEAIVLVGLGLAGVIGAAFPDGGKR